MPDEQPDNVPAEPGATTIISPAAPARAPVTVQLPGIPRPVLTDTVYISFSAEINPNTTESLIATIGNLVNQQVPHIYVLLSTPGGTVMNGMNLCNVLRSIPQSSLSTMLGMSIR